MRRSLVLPFIVAAFLSSPPLPAAAAEPAAVQGRVLDPSGQPVSGAAVSLRSGSGVIRHASSDRDGSFVFPELPPGTYDAIATLDGFRASAVRLTVAAAETRRADIALQLAAVTDTVIVSASYVELPRSEVTAEVTALTRRELDDRQLTTVADAIRLAPGTTVAPSGGLGSVTSVFPRGGESDYTLVLVDGVKLNSFGGGFDFGHLTTFGLGQLEVVRGPQSAVFGSDAIGGVVQLRSKIGGRPSVSSLIESGSCGTTRLAAGTTGSRGAVDWGVSVERTGSDGWTDAAPATTDRVTNDDYRASTLSLAANWRAGERSTLRVDGRFGTNERGNPGPFGSNPVGAYPGIDRVSRGTNDFGLGAVSFTHEWNPKTAFRVNASFVDERSTFVSPWGNSEARTRRVAAHGQVDRSITQALSASAGAALEVERADSTYITGAAAQQVPVQRNVAGYFGELRWRSASRLFVTAGLRIEHIARGALEPDPWAYQPRPPLPEDRIISANPRAAVSYYLRTSDEGAGNWTRLHAGAGTGIRPPDAFEIAFTDNPWLKPERSKSVDGGVEQAVAGGLLVVEATGFLNRYDDLIVAVGRSTQDYSRFRTDNISNARARGVETSVALRTRRGIEARVSYTFLDTTILGVDRAAGVAPAPFRVGDWLLRRPRHQASVDLLWRHRRATMYVRGGGRSQVLDVEPNWGASGGLFHAPGFAVADAGATVRLTGQLDALVRVDNLFNRQYEAAFGYPAPRRAFTVGVRLAAGR
jgi:outer membrane cobalamin receptor